MNTCCYVALLRGINAGRARRIAMADLRKLVADLGFADVRSMLNSGNVVFRGGSRAGKDIAARIEEALVMRLGVATRVTVLERGELAKVIHENPLAAIATEAARLLVFILRRPKDGCLVEPLLAQEWGSEALAVGSRAAYVWCPEGVLQSRAAAAVGTLLGDGTTSRNWGTLRKLHELCLAVEAGTAGVQPGKVAGPRAG